MFRSQCARPLWWGYTPPIVSARPFRPMFTTYPCEGALDRIFSSNLWKQQQQQNSTKHGSERSGYGSAKLCSTNSIKIMFNFCLVMRLIFKSLVWRADLDGIRTNCQACSVGYVLASHFCDLGSLPGKLSLGRIGRSFSGIPVSLHENYNWDNSICANKGYLWKMVVTCNIISFIG